MLPSSRSILILKIFDCAFISFMCVHVHRPQNVCKGQETTCRDPFFLSAVKGPGMELQLSGWQSEPLPPEVLLAHAHQILDMH